MSFNTTVEGGWSVMESKDCNFFLYPYIHSEMKVFKSTKPPSQFQSFSSLGQLNEILRYSWS